MRACGRSRRRWHCDVSMDHRGNDLYMVWIGSTRGRLWDCIILAGCLEGENCYLLRTLHGVDEVSAYNVIKLLRLTNLNTVRFMGSNSRRHSVASLNTGTILLRRSENLRNLDVTGHSKRARRQTCVIFQWSENLPFVFWTLRLRGLTPTAAGSRGGFFFFLWFSSVTSYESWSTLSFVKISPAYIERTFSAAWASQFWNRSHVIWETKNNKKKTRRRIRRKKRRNRKSRRKRKKWLTVGQLNMLG